MTAACGELIDGVMECIHLQTRTVKIPSRMKIQPQPAISAMPSISMMPRASKPPKAPAAVAAEKNIAIRRPHSWRRYQSVMLDVVNTYSPMMARNRIY